MGMMFSPINYASPQLFTLLTHDFRLGLREGATTTKSRGHPHQFGINSKMAVGESAPILTTTTTAAATTTKGVRDSLEWLSPPPEKERLAFDAMRKEVGWSASKRLRIALFHFVYW